MRARFGSRRLEQRGGLLTPARRAILDEVQRRGRSSSVTRPKALTKLGSVLSPNS